MANPSTNVGFEIESFKKTLNDAATVVKTHLDLIKNKDPKDINIGDMFEMQLKMNRLSQLSDMTTNVVSASNQAITGITRNVKG